MKYTIDRFEGKWTVCEASNGKMVDIGKSKQSKSAHANNVIVQENGKFGVDKKETEKWWKEIKELINQIFRYLRTKKFLMRKGILSFNSKIQKFIHSWFANNVKCKI